MTTTLEVINHMLNAIGETAVTSPASQHPSVLSAKVELTRVSKEVQSKGWWFNTEYQLTLSPNESGQIVIPSDTLYIETTGADVLTRRGGKLYDPVNHTFRIDKDINCNIVLELPIEDLPASAAAYIKHRATFDFYVNDDGDESKSNQLEKRVALSWRELYAEELKVSKVNAHNRPTAQMLRYRMQQVGVAYNPLLPGGR